MNRPICVGCKVEYYCDKNDVWVNDKAVPGFPATYWSGDRWVCPSCGHSLIVGRGAPRSPGTEPEDSLQFDYNVANVD